MKWESDKHVVCGGSCSECVRCLRLYLSDAEDWEGVCVSSRKIITTYARYRNIDSNISEPSSAACLHCTVSSGFRLLFEDEPF